MAGIRRRLHATHRRWSIYDVSVFPRLPVLLLMLMPVPALAQNALDANLHANEGKMNPTANREDYRSRNLVVTGDVAGGRGFRGNVGYTAEGDFRGSTGGDGSMQFRRDSALSSANLARTQSSGDTFSMMRDSGAMEYRRDFAGASQRGAAGAPPAAATRHRLDQESNRLATDRLLTMDTASSPMARYQTRTGDTGTLTASTVRGIKRESDRSRRGDDRLNLYEAARLQDDLRRGLLRMDASSARALTPFAVAKWKADAAKGGTRDPRSMSATELAIERMNTGASAYDGMVRKIQRNWQQRPSSGRPKPAASDEASKAVEPSGADAGSTDASADDGLGTAYESLRRRLDREPATPAEANEASARSGPEMTAEEYALVLRHGTRLDAFGEGGQDRLDELLAEGQRAMREGNNFIAEKRFEVALLLKPDDPRATAGLLHCQIGANLAGSASITLRKLFTQSPEMMDVTYAPEALPQTPRLIKALESARTRMGSNRDPADYGLLVAYIGRLLGDRAVIQEGLAKVTGTPSDDTLAALLRRLWIDPPPAPVEEPAQPAPVPEPPKPSEPPVPAADPVKTEVAEPAKPSPAERPTTTP